MKRPYSLISGMLRTTLLRLMLFIRKLLTIPALLLDTLIARIKSTTLEHLALHRRTLLQSVIPSVNGL